MIDKDGNVKEYTKDFVNYLDEKINVLYTGDGVVCDGISDESYKMAIDIYKRDLGIWWNYPVNDFLPSKLALGPIEKLPTSNVKSIFYNPMGEVQLSKIALATGGEYAYSPETYDSDKSWDRVLKDQFGDISEAMKVFATHSRHMENTWAKVGPPDAPEFYELGHQAILDVRMKKVPDFSLLLELIDKMDNAAEILLKKLPSEILSECKLQLQQFKRIIYADRIAVKSLKDRELDSNLKNLRRDINKYESEARLSEESAVKFIDEVIDMFEKKN
jgi:hyaluronoglucosaminidase